MRKLKHPLFNWQIFVLLLSVLVISSAGHALKTQDRLPGLHIVIDSHPKDIIVGETVQVDIFADPAVDLISMGIKISFDAEILQVQSAAKNEDFDSGWIMDADGDRPTTDDQYALPAVEIDNEAGTVTMIGGRLIGISTDGLSGNVLLGSIDFIAVKSKDSFLFVDFARYHPSHPEMTYDNFVRLNGDVDEPINIPGVVGQIRIGDERALEVDGLEPDPVGQASQLPVK